MTVGELLSKPMDSARWDRRAKDARIRVPRRRRVGKVIRGAFPARVLRRSAPAHQHRVRPRAAAEGGPLPPRSASDGTINALGGPPLPRPCLLCRAACRQEGWAFSPRQSALRMRSRRRRLETAPRKPRLRLEPSPASPVPERSTPRLRAVDGAPRWPRWPARPSIKRATRRCPDPGAGSQIAGNEGGMPWHLDPLFPLAGARR